MSVETPVSPVKCAVALDWTRAQIFTQSFETAERKLLIRGGSDAHYVRTGHLVFARAGRLMAVPFDPVRLEVTGSEVPVIDAINLAIYTGDLNLETGVAQFSFSGTGMLAYVLGSVFPERTYTPVWVDRQGREESLGWTRSTMAQGVFLLMADRSCSPGPIRLAMSGSSMWIGRRCAVRPLKETTEEPFGGLERSILRSSRIETDARASIPRKSIPGRGGGKAGDRESGSTSVQFVVSGRPAPGFRNRR